MGVLHLQLVIGNWSSGSLQGWGHLLTPHRLESRHHGQVAAGKNATDINLVVTVMQLYSLGIRKFCIVASDSDYTPLIEFLCAQGCLVMVIGNATTPYSLQKACSVFITIIATQGVNVSKTMQSTSKSEVLPARMSQKQLKSWILEELASCESSPYAWIQVSQLGNALVRSQSSFTPKEYGYKNIRIVLQAFPELFQLRPYKGQEHVHEVRRVRIKALR